MPIQKQIGFHRVYFKTLLEYEQVKNRAMSLGLKMSVYIREVIIADLKAHGYDTLATREEINARGSSFINQAGLNPPMRPPPTEEDFEDFMRLRKESEEEKPFSLKDILESPDEEDEDKELKES